jgi:hypothetical protein
MDMGGQWSNALEESYQRITHNEWDMSDFYTVLQTLKPFTFGAEEVDSGFGTLIKNPT